MAGITGGARRAAEAASPDFALRRKRSFRGTPRPLLSRRSAMRATEIDAATLRGYVDTPPAWVSATPHPPGRFAAWRPAHKRAREERDDPPAPAAAEAVHRTGGQQ